MTTDKTKSLWGQDFRLVAEGLAETDVVIFVERLMRGHRQSLEQLDHIASLHELAKKTVEDAEKIASTIIEEARSEANAEAERIFAEATRKAGEIVEEGELAAGERSEAAREDIEAQEAELRARTLERTSRIDSALRTLVDAAKLELSTRMRSHYLGKHLYESVHFIPAFERLIRDVEKDLSGARDGGPATRVVEPEEADESAGPGEVEEAESPAPNPTDP